MNNLPCLHDPRSGERKFAFADYGSRLLENLCAERRDGLTLHVERFSGTVPAPDGAAGTRPTSPSHGWLAMG